MALPLGAYVRHHAPQRTGLWVAAQGSGCPCVSIAVVWIVVAAAVAVAILPGRAPSAQVLNQQLWGTDNTVTTMAQAGTTLYIGGAFHWVGPCTGGGLPFSALTGSARRFPRVDGAVAAAAPDGAGGWYIGGYFTAVGGLPRANLAHILADGSVDIWNPGANTAVSCLVLHGRTLYVGGFFATIGGQARQYLAALDATTGIASAWNPHPNGLVFSVAVKGHTLYVGGGQFSTITGQPRNNLAAFDLPRGTLTAWNPNADGLVYAITTSGRTIYVGGRFGHVGGEERNGLAALNDTSGVPTAWNPDPGSPTTRPDANAVVHAIAVNGRIVYVGGSFGRIGGEARTALAAIDVVSAHATVWNPRVGGPQPIVGAIAARGGTIYVAGQFSTVAGEARDNAAALDATTGAALPWSPSVHGWAGTLAVSGSTIYVGGNFKIVGGAYRHGLAALDLTTGALKNWIPNPDGIAVNALVVRDNTVYVGGDFTTIGGQARVAIAALDTVTGTATAWNPGADEVVESIVVQGGTVYAGGVFTHVAGVERRYLAAIDAHTGHATPWNPSPDDWVLSLALAGDRIYAGGFFDHIGTTRRSSLAAIDLGSGAATPWNPNPDGFVDAIAVHGGTVFVGGGFSVMGGAPRMAVAALDTTTGAATTWDPSPTGALQDPLPVVYTLTTDGNAVYVGGDFYRIGGQVRKCVAALDAGTGVALDWDAAADNVVWSLMASGSNLYIGGVFNSVSNYPQTCLAAFSIADPLLAAEVSARPAPTVRLDQNTPNPTRTTSLIRFIVPTTGPASLRIYDLQGRRIATLLDHEQLAAGLHEAILRTKSWPVGCYIYRLEAGGAVLTRKMLVIR